MMHGMAAGPFWGMVAVAVFTGIVTIVCFALMFRYLFHPGEEDPRHPKYSILRKDR